MWNDTANVVNSTTASPLDNDTTETVTANCAHRVARSEALSYMVTQSVLHILLEVLVILANALTIIAIWKFPKLRTVTNNFVISLCVADLVPAPSYIAYQFYRYFIRGTPTGWHLLYQCLPPVVSYGISLLTLLQIAIDRFIAVAYNTVYKSAMTTRRARLMIVGAWVYWVGLTTFLISYLGTDAAAAERVLQSGRMMDAFPPAVRTGALGSQMYGGILLTILLYARIFWALKKQKEKIRAKGDVPSAAEERTKKVTHLMSIILVVLLVTWMPLLIVDTLMTSLDTPDWVNYLRDAALFLTRSNSAMNAFLYAWKSTAFREAFVRLLTWRRARVTDVQPAMALRA